MTRRQKRPPRRLKTPPLRSAPEEAERLARECDADADGTYAHLRPENERAANRAIAEGFRGGALLPVEPVWRPGEHGLTPPADWIEQHQAIRAYAETRLEAEGLELPACRACDGRYCGRGAP